jgi:hypothetical protein
VDPRRFLTASLVLCSLVLVACGADQDPALEVPDADATTTSAAAAPGGPTSAAASFGPIRLTGAAEIPGPGAEDGTGVANVFLDTDGSICYDFISVVGIDTPTAAHIHEGGESEAGPVVLSLETPTDLSLNACAADQAELSARIAENPAGFYVNVHNAEFPEGAIRGQLGS